MGSLRSSHCVRGVTAGPQSSPAGVFVSHDGGDTWSRLSGDGLPRGGTAVNIAVAANTSARRLYALAGRRGGAAGLYRSDDGGVSWTLTTGRLASAGGHLYVDPRDPDIVYTMGTSVYRSTDGGRTLTAIKGAPGGDDPHAMWIDPQNPGRMIVGADQGPTISVDAGRTWTPWYVLPNGELYFVSTDNAFPYRVYAAQQDSGTVSILSRSDYGAIRPSDWFPVSGYEQGHIFADPLDARFVALAWRWSPIVRFDRVTGQVIPVYTPAAEDRFGPRPGMDLSPKGSALDVRRRAMGPRVERSRDMDEAQSGSHFSRRCCNDRASGHRHHRGARRVAARSSMSSGWGRRTVSSTSRKTGGARGRT